MYTSVYVQATKQYQLLTFYISFFVEIDADSERNTHRITGLTAGRPYQALIQSIVVDANGNDLESLPVSVAFLTGK